MSVVILAEKPDQAKAYTEAFHKVTRKDGYFEIQDSRFFNDTVHITWAFGHLVSLANPETYQERWKKWSLQELPIIPEKFNFMVPNEKRKQFNVVKGLLEKASLIVVATDSDREGENIARSIIAHAKQAQKPTKRLWINSLEADEITKGMQNLKAGEGYLNLYKEAQTRQFSDWLVGINSSRLYTLLLQKKGIQDHFSVGRVQTPSLYLIYKRQKDIENFQSVPFFELMANVTVEGGAFTAKYKDRFPSLQELQELLSKHGLEKEDQPGLIQRVQKELKRSTSPKLHSLSSLQGKANKLWKYSPANVLKIVQGLYEKKLLSYPRTDSHFITENEFAYLKEHVDDYKNTLNLQFKIAYPEARKAYVDNKKVQEHYAIIPTKKAAVLQELSPEEQNIYHEVVTTTLAMFAPDYEYEETTVEVNVNSLVFVRKGKVEKNPGWKQLFKKLDDETENTKQNEALEGTLPPIYEGEQGKVSLSPKEGNTQPPKPYTEGQLIQMMKTAGKELSDEYQAILKGTEGIGTEATRASIIETLKAQKYIEVKKNIVSVTKKGEILCQAVEGSLLASAEMTAKWEESLALIGKGKGSQEHFLKNIYAFLSSLLEKAPKQLGALDAEIQSLSQAAVDADSLGPCPNCQKGGIQNKGKFYGCTEYRNGCTFTLPKQFAGKAISDANVKKLIKGNKTTLIKGFISQKTKKSYDAYLVLKEGKISFEFPTKK